MKSLYDISPTARFSSFITRRRESVERALNDSCVAPIFLHAHHLLLYYYRTTYALYWASVVQIFALWVPLNTCVHRNFTSASHLKYSRAFYKYLSMYPGPRPKIWEVRSPASIVITWLRRPYRRRSILKPFEYLSTLINSYTSLNDANVRYRLLGCIQCLATQVPISCRPSKRSSPNIRFEVTLHGRFCTSHPMHVVWIPRRFMHCSNEVYVYEIRKMLAWIRVLYCA
jgi:hypothetical protein